MKQVVSKGYAQGLSNHSSMQHSSAIFNQSEVFEVSSISKKPNKSFSKSDGLPDILNLNCRFCGRNQKSSRLFPVCKCPEKFLAHQKCLNGQAEGKCKKCGVKWISEVSDFQCSPEILIDNSHNLSRLNESEGEFRMRNTIKAALERPKCRYCGSETETEDNKIIYPCQCHTLDYKLARAHRKCVFDRALYLHSDECENCKIQFNFTPIYKSIWVWADLDELNRYLADSFKFFLLGGAFVALAVFLFIVQEFYEDDEVLWIWSVVLRSLLLVVGSVYSLLFFAVFCNVRGKVVATLEVLCQKQEIARMSSGSHEVFFRFLQGLIEKSVIPKEPALIQRVLAFKKNQNGIRRVVELDTNGENIESDMLKEFSSSKASQSIRNSEDFKEEDINEHSLSE